VVADWRFVHRKDIAIAGSKPNATLSQRCWLLPIVGLPNIGKISQHTAGRAPWTAIVRYDPIRPNSFLAGCAMSSLFSQAKEDACRERLSGFTRSAPAMRVAAMSKSLRTNAARAAILAAGLFVTTPLLAGDRQYRQGASDTEIKIGQTMPYSGPLSASSVIGKVQAAYFRMINDHGGVNGRKITLISYDDAATPSKTVEQVRRLIESDEVLLTFQTLGNASNIAVQKYLMTARSLSSSWPGGRRVRGSDQFPLDDGICSQSAHGGSRLRALRPGSISECQKIGLLYQNDESGRDYLIGLKDALGARAGELIVSDASYDVSDPTVDSQVVRLKAAGVDVLVNMAAPKFAAQVIRKMAELDWKPFTSLAWARPRSTRS